MTAEIKDTGRSTRKLQEALTGFEELRHRVAEINTQLRNAKEVVGPLVQEIKLQLESAKSEINLQKDYIFNLGPSEIRIEKVVMRSELKEILSNVAGKLESLVAEQESLLEKIRAKQARLVRLAKESNVNVNEG